MVITGCGKKQPAADSSSPPTIGLPTATEESPQHKLSLGQQRLQQGDHQAASQIAQEILLQQPSNGAAMVLAGQAALAAGDVDAGVELLDAAAELLPQQSSALAIQATAALWQENRLAEVQQRFIEILNQQPTFDDARRGLSEVLNRQGYRFDANQQIRILCRRSGVQVSIDELRCLIVPSRSYYPFASKPAIDDRQWVQSMGELNVARALFGEGDIRDALQVLESSDALQQRHPAAVAFHGQVLLESQQFDKFERWLLAAEKACQNYPAYWMALGGWALRKQQPRQAVRMFGEAILREPGDVAAHERMLQSLLASEQTEAAKLFEERAMEVRGSTKMTNLILNNDQLGPDAFRDLAELLDKLGRPFEAISWRSLAAMQSGPPQQAMMQANIERQRALQSESAQQTRQQLLCGLDLAAFKFDVAKLMPNQSPNADSPRSDNELPPAAQPRFVNIAKSVGLDFRYVNADPPKERYFLMHEAVGSGVACFDYDLDGRVDLYVGQGACNAPDGRGKLPNLLARNIGSAFRTVTEPAGCDDRRYTLGVTAGDWNQDGFPDLVVGNMTRNQLLINQGDGTFRPQAGDELWDDGEYTASLAIADVTGDQLPEIIEVTYLDDPKIFDPLELNDEGRPVRFPGPLHFSACLDRVFVSSGDGTMRGQLLDADSPSPGLGILVTDIDGKVGNEIFVANDMKANHLWLPTVEADGRVEFTDAAVARGVAYGPSGTPLACMGIAAADFDENGYLDLHITNFSDQWTNQYMQNAEGLFDDLTLPFGLDQSTLKTLGFGTEAFDFDNNTSIDLMTGNGHIDDLSHEGTPFEMPTQFFVGDRSTLRLTPVEGDPDYWNSDHLTRGLITLDWNNDGRVDVVTTDLKEPIALLENQTDSTYHWIKLRLVGTLCERDAIGATLSLRLQTGRRLTRKIQTGDGYMSKNDPTICVGLGSATEVTELRIQWPDGMSQTLRGLQADRSWLIIQDMPAHLFAEDKTIP